MRTLRSVDQSIGDDRPRLSNGTISVHEDRRFVFVVGFSSYSAGVERGIGGRAEGTGVCQGERGI